MSEYSLVLNAGSSSLKFCVYDGDAVAARHARPDRRHRHVAAIHREKRSRPRRLPSSVSKARSPMPARRSTQSPAGCAHSIADARVLAVGHRVVHGGSRYRGPVVVTPQVLEDLRTLIPLAPLHQPYNLAAIDAVFERMPKVPQVACFDTSFHRGQPAVASLVPLPREVCQAGVQRYGFHGLSYQVHRVGPAEGGPAGRRWPRHRRASRQRREPLCAARAGRASTARSDSPRSTGSAWARGPAPSIPA